jgi:hypothetical protein
VEKSGTLSKKYGYHYYGASLIRPIWRIFKGLEAADMVL